MSGKTFDDVRAKCDCPAVITGFLDKSSKSERFLALAISHEHSSEAALFLVRSKDLTITHVVPIYAGVHLKVEALNAPKLESYGMNSTLWIEGGVIGCKGAILPRLSFHVSATHLTVFTERFAELSSLAALHKFNPGGSTHKWLILPAGSSDVVLPALSIPEAGAITTDPPKSPKLPAKAVQSDQDFFNEHVAQKQFEYNPQSMQMLKGQWLSEQLQGRAAEFTHYEPVTVCIGTYNVNGRVPKEPTGEVMNLSSWLKSKVASVQAPDIYAFGFQELDLSAEAFVFKDSSREADWVRAIEDSFPEDHNYYKLKSKQLVGLLIVVYVKRSLLSKISNVQSDAQGTGILGVMGNKGGVAVRFQLYDTSICFVNSHLAAHDDAITRRNQDYKTILRRLSLGEFGVQDHDTVFWFGDLNYRIDGLGANIKQEALAGHYDTLLKRDQLLAQRSVNNVFEDFTEGKITFPPTYKYDPGTDTFDTSEKQRSPAYCDRVLHWTAPDSPGVEQVEYTSAHELRLSDHKPVRAVYTVQCSVVDAEQQRKVLGSIVRALDSIENQSIPDASLSSNQLQFQDLRFMEPQSQSITLQNTGQVMVKFRFISKLDEQVVHPPWLTIRPLAGVLVPGEKRSIVFSANLDAKLAAQYNISGAKLEDILVLHLENGKDCFISVAGNFLRTCFCLHLDALVEIYTPMQLVKPGPLGKPTTKTRLKIPKELWRLVDYLHTHGREEPSLFLISGVDPQCRAIRNCLNTGKPFPEGYSVHSYAETLIYFLDSLPEPLIPYVMYPRCIECSHSYILCRQILGDLSQTNRTVFVYIIKFLHELLRHRSKNRLSSEKLAAIFGLVILRAPASRKAGVTPGSRAAIGASGANVNRQKRAAYLQHFLVIDDL